MIKSEQELGHLRRAGALADAAFVELLEVRFAGRSERSIAEDLNGLLRDQGLLVSGHLPIVASGPNSASPHHLTGEREIHEGDAVVLDFGGTVEKYYADITRTVHVGTPDDDFRGVYAVVRQAQEAGVQAVSPGVEAQEVDTVTRGVIGAAGYADFFIHRTGHGIGLEGHEEPYIVEGNALTLASGMAFSVEPGVYLPGRFGVRIEDIVAVTNDGVERLNQASLELAVVH
jgi:D-alanyl-D-alanine dipeptidase